MFKIHYAEQGKARSKSFDTAAEAESEALVLASFAGLPVKLTDADGDLLMSVSDGEIRRYEPTPKVKAPDADLTARINAIADLLGVK